VVDKVEVGESFSKYFSFHLPIIISPKISFFDLLLLADTLHPFVDAAPRDSVSHKSINKKINERK
jgi:hypothetical protein